MTLSNTGPEWVHTNCAIVCLIGTAIGLLGWCDTPSSGFPLSPQLELSQLALTQTSQLELSQLVLTLLGCLVCLAGLTLLWLSSVDAAGTHSWLPANLSL